MSQILNQMCVQPGGWMVGRTAIDSRADRLHVEVLRLALQIRNGLVANLHPCVTEPLLARPSCSEAALTGRASHVQPRARLGPVAATNALFDLYARGGRPLVVANLLGWRRDVPPRASSRPKHCWYSSCRRLRQTMRSVALASVRTLAGGSADRPVEHAVVSTHYRVASSAAVLPAATPNGCQR